jgi:hypothetical protein
MNNYSIFFNNKFTIEHKDAKGIDTFEPITKSEKLLNAGDWFLSPVRCLFNGREVVIAEKPSSYSIRETISISSDFEYQQHDFESECSAKPKRSLGRMIAAIALFVPGLLIGTALKALAFKISDDMKNLHAKVHTHYTPIDKQIFGSRESPISFDDFKKEYENFSKRNTYSQHVNKIAGYALPADKDLIEGYMFAKSINAFISIHSVHAPAGSMNQVPADV